VSLSDEQGVIYLNSIEDIEQVFKAGHLNEILAVLREPELQDLWRLPDGQRVLAILHDRTDLPKGKLRAMLAAAKTHSPGRPAKK
jgi:hypothetical protein